VLLQFDEQVAAAIELPTPGCSKLLRNHIAAMESEFDKGNAAAVKKAMGAANLVGTKMGDKDFCECTVPCSLFALSLARVNIHCSSRVHGVRWGRDG
jgi:hypothetical protein